MCQATHVLRCHILRSARLVLAGDPKQLGPVILSRLAAVHGMATSTMERLIGVAPYERARDPVSTGLVSVC
jgi:superfamily I DNA and/or RNA helicase